MELLNRRFVENSRKIGSKIVRNTQTAKCEKDLFKISSQKLNKKIKLINQKISQR